MILLYGSSVEIVENFLLFLPLYALQFLVTMPIGMTNAKQFEAIKTTLNYFEGVSNIIQTMQIEVSKGPIVGVLWLMNLDSKRKYLT